MCKTEESFSIVKSEFTPLTSGTVTRGREPGALTLRSVSCWPVNHVMESACIIQLQWGWGGGLRCHHSSIPVLI